MSKQVIAVLDKKYVRMYELFYNKVLCAKQVLRPNAVPRFAPRAAAEKFFREAIFAYADAQYLQDSFWQDLARQYGVEPKDREKLYVDFNTNELFIRD